MTDDVWTNLTDRFVEGAYATVKGRVRTYVLHHHLMDHLPPPPAAVLDVGGGAGHQSLPLARMGYEIVLLDSSEAMLSAAEQCLGAESADVCNRVRLVLGRGEDAPSLTQGRRFAAVLCHGVLMYLPEPASMIESLCACTAVDGIISVMALNAATLAVRPALEHRWNDAQAAFHAQSERGVLGLDTRADTVEELSSTFADHGVRPLAWYGVWLFTDWMTLDADEDELTTIAEVELEASRRDPYRHLSRVFHLVGRRCLDAAAEPLPDTPCRDAVATTAKTSGVSHSWFERATLAFTPAEFARAPALRDLAPAAPHGAAAAHRRAEPPPGEPQR